MQENREIERNLREQSHFISAARFLMICGLTYHHLFEIPGSINSPRLNLAGHVHFLPEFINAFFHMAFMAAVPVLSVLSGYLFFRGGEVDFRAKLKRRFFSVALPAWLWCALWLALAWALWSLAAGAAPFAWADYNFNDFAMRDLVNAVFALRQPPFAFQFWFIRDLILTLLLSPILYLLLRRFGGSLVLAGLALWFLLPSVPLFFSGNVPMFFAIGAWLALPHGPDLGAALERARAAMYLLIPVFVLLLVARLMAHRFGDLEAVLGGEYFLRLLRLSGVLAISALLFEAVRRDWAPARFLVRYSPWSFFIFAAHFPLIELLQIPVTWIPGHDSALGLFLSWLCIPLLTIVLAIQLGRLLEARLPAVFSLLNGGRPAGRAIAPGKTGARNAPAALTP